MEDGPYILDRLRRGERVENFETVRRRKNGTKLEVSVTVSPIKDAIGNVVGASRIAREVTGKRRSDYAAQLLSPIVDSSDDAIVSKDLSGTITSWNQGAYRLFGYTADEAIGRSITILITPDRLDEERTILRRLQSGERIDHFETTRRRKDGSPVEISLTVSPVKDSQGRIVGASKIARDITERRNAEAALLNSQERFRQLADSMPQIVWSARPDGYLDYYNERWYEYRL